MSDEEFYNPSRLLSYDADVNMLTMLRGNGKTYFCKTRCLKDFFNNHHQFIIAKQTDKQMDIVKSTFFDDYKKTGEMKDQLKGLSVKGNRILYKSSPTSLIEVAGHFLSLNTATNSKGLVVPFADNFLFDEFIPDMGRDYLANEDILFSSIISTIFRRKPHAKIFMTANNISTDCPYFRMFDISFKDESGFCFRQWKSTDENGKEICHKVICQYKDTNEKIRKESESSLAGWIAGLTDYSKSSVKGEFYLDDNKNVVERNKIKSPIYEYFNLWHNDVTMTIYSSRSNFYYIGIPSEGSKKVPTFVYNNFSKASDDNCHILSRQSTIRPFLLKLIVNEKVAFENVRFKNVFMDLLDKIK